MTGLEDCLPINESLTWWKGLPIHKKLLVKELCEDIVGMNWSNILILFNGLERIQIIHTKIKFLIDEYDRTSQH